MSETPGTQRGWAINSIYYGLYTGWWLTRNDAIASHVHNVEGVKQQFALGKLNKDQRRAWAKCKRRGDRAVKVKILTLIEF